MTESRRGRRPICDGKVSFNSAIRLKEECLLYVLNYRNETGKPLSYVLGSLIELGYNEICKTMEIDNL